MYITLFKHVFVNSKLILCAIISLSKVSLTFAQTEKDWSALNTHIQLSVGLKKSHYVEVDTQSKIPSEILDSELGVMSNVGLSLRWQAKNGFLSQVDYERDTGSSRYEGYLQFSNGSLQPFSTTTGNLRQRIGLQVGYALNDSVLSAVPKNMQIAAITHSNITSWQRDLAQYSESYRLGAYGAGVQIQWRANPSVVIEIQSLTGKMKTAKVSVPAFGFSSTQRGGRFQELKIGVVQDLSAISSMPILNGWAFATNYTHTNFNHFESAVMNGLQAPPSSVKTAQWSFAIRRQL